MKKSLPMSAGGIVQYFDESGSKIEITPKQIIFFTFLLVVIVLVLRITNIFGF